MGEEGKKPEEKKSEEEKKTELKLEAEKSKSEEVKNEGGTEVGENGKKVAGDEGKGEAAPPPGPPEEILMRVFMHCEGCARKVKRSLKGFDGVEEVMTDCKTHKVVVKGKKAAEDPLKIVERVQKKSGRKVELLTPLPTEKIEKKEEEKKEEKPKNEEKKEMPVVVAVVLKVHMHCEACALQIKRRILRMKGVQAAEPDLKASKVTVKGTMDPQKLVEYVYKRTGKHSVIVSTEPAEKKPDETEPSPADQKKPPNGETGSGGDDKKAGDVTNEEKKNEGEKKGENGGEDKEKEVGLPEDAAGGVKLRRNELYYCYNRYPMEVQACGPRFTMEDQACAPQLFSDENPNACCVM